MRLLIENQLPIALVKWLANAGEQATHVLEAGLGQVSDAEIWAHALLDSSIVVSKDDDFFLLANRPNDVGRLLALAAACGAIRDIARNSFKIARAFENSE